MLESDTFIAARALITTHGTEALAVAERAAANVGRLGMIESLSQPRAARAAGPTARPSDRAC
jgi:hypothetical protein